MPSGVYTRTKKNRENLSKAHLNQIPWNKGKEMPNFRGENHPNWLGENAKRFAKHTWVVRKKGKASSHICKCGKKAVDWSNKDHKYKRNLNDYQAFCRSCHNKWDIKYNDKDISSFKKSKRGKIYGK